MKLFLKIFGVILLLVIIGAIAGAAYAYQQLKPPMDQAGEAQSVQFIVKEGEGLASISQRLETQGLIRNARVFGYYVIYYKKLDKSISHGIHILNAKMTAEEVANELAAVGGVDTVSFVFPEGRNRFDLAKILVEAKLAQSEQEVLDAISSREVLEKFFGKERVEKENILSLEGFLYPAGYQVVVNTPVVEVLRIMVDEFMNRFTISEVDQQLATLELNMLEWVTLASMVEAEARDPKEHQIIADLYFSRLKVYDMKIECDPTVKYGLILEGKWNGDYRSSITARLASGRIDWDSFDSPYNTYHTNVRGLPPGPIGNPRESALKAVLSASRTEVKYMYADPERYGTPEHCFSRTLHDHNRCMSANSGRTPETDDVTFQ